MGQDKRDAAVNEFLADIIKVCRVHGMSLSHEDCQGAFKVEDLSEYNIDWLVDAYDARNSR